VLFCHATPQNDSDILARLTPEEKLIPIFDGCDADAMNSRPRMFCASIRGADVASVWGDLVSLGLEHFFASGIIQLTYEPGPKRRRKRAR
jgi:hypothetical protein